MPKVSVTMISKDAAKYLAKSLKSVLWANEIIIVDSGSTDQTLQIARNFGAKIFKKKWLGYAKQKNYAISKAKNRWVLSLDADEVVSNELANSIKNFQPFEFSGYYIARKNFFAGKWVKHCGWYPDWQLRLFDKTKTKFEEKEVHEAVKPIGKIGYLKGDIIHYTYSSDKEYFKKIEYYTTLDAKILYKKGKKWSILYQVGKPIKEFCQKYFIQKGFLDGMLGLKICFYSAYYRWQVAKKLKGFYK